VKRYQNTLLTIAVVTLSILPLLIVPKPVEGPDGKTSEIFVGADDRAKSLIADIAPDFQPWLKPILEPVSGEISSLLFALQAALGAGFIGYYLGAAVTREKMRKDKTPTGQSES